MTTERLPHGDTNATRREGGVVRKRYLGPDARSRQRAEVLALRRLGDVLPVPRLVHEGDGEITTAHVPGHPGQELIEISPDAVLHCVGRTAARLQAVDPTRWDLTPSRPGDVIVHGDFGPQNLLLGDLTAENTGANTGGNTVEVAAVLDWEFTHLGDSVLDVAWAEWIVRNHHPHLVAALPSLFEGYGREPAWDRRHAAMVARCDWALGFVTRWSPRDDVARRRWEDRRTATLTFRP